MRDLNVKEIEEAVRSMCIKTNMELGQDIFSAIKGSIEREQSPIGREVLMKLVQNAKAAKTENMPICQDTGMAVVFVDIGQEVQLLGGALTEAINRGVSKGYREGYLRKSVVEDPLIRKNTGDNTPAVIHYDIVPGSRVKIILAPKGFGSENMSAIKMLKPSDGQRGVIDFVVKTVSQAGPDPCPPIVVGVGIGGTFEKAALLSKRALMRPLGSHHTAPHIKELEETLLHRINCLGIGPQGLGGSTTALGVHIETFATHIAGLPVAVNISCHVTRHEEMIL